MDGRKMMFFKVSTASILLFALLTQSLATSHVFDVRDYGAIGDGETDDTDAFMKAWEATCMSPSSPSTMHIPSRMKFFTQPVFFEGPCKSSISVEIYGDMIAPIDPSSWRFRHDAWMHFHRVDGLSVHGSGTFDGRGHEWWQHAHENHGPTALMISHSSNVKVEGLSFRNNPHMHLVSNHLKSLNISRVTIDSPGDSPNTDGIHISSCTDVFIDHCKISTGDDCISIVDGSSNMRISNIVCGPGHGISIGSLGKHGADNRVENIHVSDVVFRGSTNGARIKTWQGGHGYARNMVFERILSQGADNPIIIDQFYCDREECATQDSAVEVRNITFRQVLGTSGGGATVSLKCSEAVPCQEIVLEDIYLRSMDDNDGFAECINAYGEARGQRVPVDHCLGSVRSI